MTDPLQQSPLHDWHALAGASFTDFGGWSMPLRYHSDLAEHHAVREHAGIFDVSHMAEIRVGGPDAGAFLDHALAGILSALAVGRAKYTLLLADNGGIIDDLIVFRLSEDEYVVVANAANRAEAVAALTARLDGFDALLRDDTVEISLLAVQGPDAQVILEQTEWLDLDPTVDGDLASLRPYSIMTMRFHGEPILVARTGYTGEDGFELFVAREHARLLWEGLVNSGVQFGMIPCGLAARDTLRLEAGLPLYGHELSREVLPVQAGLGWVIPADKTVDYVGRAAIETGPAPDARVLVGLTATGRRSARAGYEVLDGDRVVGTVTSGALAPTLGIPIAMAYVDADASAVGTRLEFDVRGRRVPATVVDLPFYTRRKPV